MRTAIQSLVLLMAALVITVGARAQGTAFTYQGRLNDGTSPANGTYDLTFTLFDVSSGGSDIARPVTNSPTIVTDGLFAVTLDFGNQFPGVGRWLEIGVRTNGGGAFTTLSPRQQITSTPYAIHAANATTVSGSVSASQLTGTISSNNIGSGTIIATMLATASVTTASLADGAVTAAKVATISNWFALTIANPTPESGDLFGYAVAAMGSDRVLVGANSDDTGASDAGAAYLFGVNGNLLTTFTNPMPANGDFFGASVATVGSDRVLITATGDSAGAPFAGAAYLFNTNGVLMGTFTNTAGTAGDRFGISASAIGTDRVLIGAFLDNTGANDAGAAYLFSTNGALIYTFTNPTPAIADRFGVSVVAVGNDRVLIGASLDNTGANDTGAAYLLSTGGVLLATFTNPTPAAGEQFGLSAAALGNDRVLIGAVGDNTGASGAGAVYLFNTNGTLLTVFTNPTPEFGEFFGSSVAAMGPDKVLIGASLENTGAADAGAAYLFNTNGTLLATFLNPAPAISDVFGISVAAVGTERIIVGAHQDDTGAANAGAAYLFSIETFADELIADGVRALSVTSASLKEAAVTVEKLADGAVTAAKLDPTIGVWTRSGDNVFRASGNVGIGTSNPVTRLTVAGAGAFNHPLAAALTLHNTSASRSWELHVLDDGRLQLADFTAGVTRMVFDLNGNVGIGNLVPSTFLQVVNATCNGNSWINSSDRALKENFACVSGRDVLEKVAVLPIQSWNYKADPGSRHIGPVAQDFYAAFSLNGTNNTQIATVDADGVALAAIQGLNQKLAEELKRRDAENAELKQRLEKIERILSEISRGGQ